ncbi:MAG: flagellar export protein FliJ [Oligoflexia bacterium]|nr:flagellar export protein FliJ [Oligoflexia bacterium]
MKKFKFRLQRVLEYRKILREERQRELLAKLHQLRLAKERLEALERAELANRIGEGDVQLLLLYMNGAYGERLKIEIASQRVAVEQAEKERDQAVELYQEAAKDEKALISLKEKKFLEYRAYLEAEDRKFLDELATQKGNLLHAD